MSARPAVLVIAGSDSSGGAGLARDIEAVEAFGADVLPVVTAVTAQSHRRVLAVHPAPPAILRAQIEAAFETRIPNAIKIGMLTNRETVAAIAEALRDVAGQNIGEIGREPAIPLVLDPVLASSSGGVLLDEAGRQALKDRLLPLTTLLTPNVPEAAALLGEPPAASAAALDQQAQRLLQLGPRCVLLKGGHASEAEAVDRLACRGQSLRRIMGPRIRASQRGTGCTLASAIAAQLGAGVPIVIACERAHAYIGERLRAAADAGR
jgi:hydroxymethylpyrimidine/phosphomethylpyrimidine kinase